MQSKEMYATKFSCSKCTRVEYIDHGRDGHPNKAYAIQRARDKGWVNKKRQGWTCHDCMLQERIYYTDFETGKGKFTTGKFIGWSRETDGKGHHMGWHATVRLPKSMLSIPAYCLTEESKSVLPPPADLLILAMILDLLAEHDMTRHAIESQIPGHRAQSTDKCWDVLLHLMKEGRVERLANNYYRDVLRLAEKDAR